MEPVSLFIVARGKPAAVSSVDTLRMTLNKKKKGGCGDINPKYQPIVSPMAWTLSVLYCWEMLHTCAVFLPYHGKHWKLRIPKKPYDSESLWVQFRYLSEAVTCILLWICKAVGLTGGHWSQNFRRVKESSHRNKVRMHLENMHKCSACVCVSNILQDFPSLQKECKME